MSTALGILVAFHPNAISLLIVCDLLIIICEFGYTKLLPKLGHSFIHEFNVKPSNLLNNVELL